MYVLIVIVGQKMVGGSTIYYNVNDVPGGGGVCVILC